MCSACEGVVAEYLLAEAETELILAEADAGESVTKAIRPLNKAEKKARTRFGDIEKSEAEAAEKAAEIVDEIGQLYVITIIGAIFGGRQTVGSADLAAKLTSINALLPHAAKDSMKTASGRLAEIFKAAHTAGAEIARAEAKRQGLTNPPKLPEADPERFAPLGQAVALAPWTRITGRLQADYLSPASLVRSEGISRDVFEKAAASISLDGALDLARQAIHTAHGGGRAEAAAEIEPAEVWASELMDGATCGPCARVDGKEYATLADALVEYETGGYGACDGGARCRGTLVFIYEK